MTKIVGIFRNLGYSEPEAYPEPWYIQNPGPCVFRALAYSEPCYIQIPRIFRTLTNIYDGALCENS